MQTSTSSKPRILLFSTAYLPLIGGSELAISHIAQRLPQYDFDLVTGRHTSDQPLVEQIGRVRVFRAGGRLSGLTLTHPKFFLPFAMAITAWRLVRTRQYVLIHTYQASQAAGAAWLVHLVHPSLPFLVTLQEGKVLDQQSWPVRWARALILWSADRITAISHYLARYAQQYNKASINIIPNGVDLAEVVRPPRNPDPTVLTVSRLVPKNNVEGIIRALPLVRNSITNIRLVIAGDGPLRSQLEALSSQLGVRDFVHFMGTVPHDDMRTVYAMADVFVRPSLSEGLGSAFLEAMSAGVPVVGSRVGGIADFLEHEQTGLVCDPSNPFDIASQIIRILTDTALRDGIVARASSMVRERYDWNVVAVQMGRVYQELMQT